MRNNGFSIQNRGNDSSEAESSRIYAWIVVLAALIVYIITACRTVGVGDSGELTVAMSTGGIAHPPGYPLYTILGLIWLKLLAFLRPALAANLFSAAAAALAALVCFRILERINSSILPAIANAALTLVFVFSFPVWSSATAAEVYALSGLLYLAALYFTIRYHEEGRGRDLIAAAFFCGLILTHHFSSAVVGAGILAGMIFRRRSLKAKTLVTAVTAFILPLTLYLYLLLRFDPDLPVNWMSEKTLYALWQLISGENYQQFVSLPTLGDFLIFIKKLSLKWLIDFGPGLTLLALPGLIFGVRRYLRLTIILILPAILNLLMVSCYRIPDYDGYLMPAIVTTIILMSICLATWWRFLSRRRWIAALIILCLIALPVATNYSRCDLSRFNLAERYGRDLLDSAPQNSILLLKSDNGSHTALYLHYLENHRMDIELYSSYSTLTRLRRTYGGSDYVRIVDSLERNTDRVFRGAEYIINQGADPSGRAGSRFGLLCGPETAQAQPGIDGRIERFIRDTLPDINLHNDLKARQISLEYRLEWIDRLIAYSDKPAVGQAMTELREWGKEIDDVPTLLAVAQFFRYRDMTDESLNWIDLAAAAAPPRYELKDVYVNQAIIYRHRRNLPSAMAALKKALEIDEEYLPAQYNAKLIEAETAMQNKDWPAAADAFGALFELDEENPLPLFNKAVILERISGRSGEALMHYRRFLQMAGEAFPRAVARARERIETLQASPEAGESQSSENRLKPIP